MASPDESAALEGQIGQWRSYLERRQTIQPVDIVELEDHLREQVAALLEAGLDTEEAFLVAVKRMGELDALSREFAAEHSERLWKQLVVGGVDEGRPAASRTDVVVAFCLAVAAAVLIKVPELFGLRFSGDFSFYARNLSLFVLPLLTGYFVWKRRVSTKTMLWLGAAFVLAAVVANVYPFASGGSTETLTALHLPIALWLAVGIAYAGDRWNRVGGRMDFIRFSGELVIYYVLIALGGGLLTGLSIAVFGSIGFNVESLFGTWVLPCGAAGAVIVASWLVESKQSVIENMAPVLTRLFTPLFAIVLVAFAGTVLLTGHGLVDRDALIAFDAVLAVVLALLLYSVSARDQLSRAGAFDVLQVVLIASALLADGIALWAIGARITALGFTPNRIAALGENVILLVNLGWSAWLYARFLRGRAPFAALEKWQTDYVPVYAVWAAIVVVVFPVLFSFR